MASSQDGAASSQDGAEDGSRVASSGKTLQFFVCFICFFVVILYYKQINKEAKPIVSCLHQQHLKRSYDAILKIIIL